MLGISEVALHVSSNVAPQCSYSGVHLNTPLLKVPKRSYLKCNNKRFSISMRFISSSSVRLNHIKIYGSALRSCFQGNMASDQLRLQRIQCHLANGINGISNDDIEGKFRKESMRKTSHVVGELNGSKLLCFEESKHSNHEKDLKPADDKSSLLGAVKHAPNKKNKTSVEDEAWRLLRESMVHYCGSPVGTIAAMDPSDANVVNYDQVFIRDFIPSGIAFLLKGEYDIVRNFILHTLQLQSWERTMDCYSPGQGLMPASFKVRTVPLDGDDSATEEVLDPDFGEAAIGRVAPVDSGLWWIILLRAYGKCSGDLTVQERIDVQTGIKLILKLCLADGFDMFPTLLVTDGSCMIDRRMGIHGHPLEIQALFYSALLCAREMLTPEDGSAVLVRALQNRLIALSFHIREYYWIDMKKLNEVYRYKTEEYSFDAVNKFNIYPDQIPPWLVEWMPDKGGYFIGNLQPAHMDFRFFSLGNLWSIVSSLATTQQSDAILDLVESKWSDLVADMPFKICYPALEGLEWQIITGSDPKNTPWSYHNGGSWPTLLWQAPVSDQVKLNVDAGITMNGSATIAGVLRDHRGHWIMGFHQLLHPMSIIEAELKSIAVGLSILNCSPFQRVIVENDSADAITLLTSDVPDQPFAGLVDDCQQILALHPNFLVQHVLRESNQLAHQLAQLAKLQDTFLYILYSPPQCISEVYDAELITDCTSF